MTRFSLQYWQMQRDPGESDADYRARLQLFIPLQHTVPATELSYDEVEAIAQLDRGEGVDFEEVMKKADAIVADAKHRIGN